MLLISYQNFTPVDYNEFDSAETLKIMQDMRNFEQGEGSSNSLAAPTGGSDLESVTSNWAERQGTVLLNGYDKKVEAAMNEKLNAWVQDLSAKDPAEEQQLSTEKNDNQEAVNFSTPEEKKRKQNLRFARINSLKYEIGESTSFNVTADPGNTRLNYSQAVNQKTKVGVEHKTSDRQTQMFLRYDW
jgi:hypothetical protein